jgi:membrane protein DedA with SNARE-associated domain
MFNLVHLFHSNSFSLTIQWFLNHGYWLLFIFTIIEGPILSVLCGLAVHLHYTHFWPVYLTLMAGDLSGDIIWYYIGKHGLRRFIHRFGKFFSLKEENIAVVERIFKKNQTKTLIISKLTTGFGFALLTLMIAGAIGVPFKKYMTINFLGQFIWSGMLMTIGYFFGQFYQNIDAGFRIAAILAFILIVFTLLYGFQKYARAKVAKTS